MKNLDLAVFEKWWAENFDSQLRRKGLTDELIEQFKGMAERGWCARYFHEKNELKVSA